MSRIPVVKVVREKRYKTIRYTGKPALKRGVELVADMGRRLDELTAAGDKKGLLTLAEEYKALHGGGENIARKILQLCEGL
jgi:hypothetical protein